MFTIIIDGVSFILSDKVNFSSLLYCHYDITIMNVLTIE